MCHIPSVADAKPEGTKFKLTVRTCSETRDDSLTMVIGPGVKSPVASCAVYID